jgi:hypothetical protein
MPAASVTGELDEPTKVLLVFQSTYTKSQSGELTFITQLLVAVLQGPPLSSVVRVTVKLPSLGKVILVEEAVGVADVAAEGLQELGGHLAVIHTLVGCTREEGKRERTATHLCQHNHVALMGKLDPFYVPENNLSTLGTLTQDTWRTIQGFANSLH